MSCKLKINKKGVTTGILNKNGKDSKFFRQIVSNPHLTKEQAIESYKNIFAKEGLSDESILQYRNNKGEIFDTYAQAIRNTDKGNIIGELEGGEKMFEVSSDSNMDTYHGLINNLIKEKLLTGEQILDVDGRLIHQVEGQTEIKKIINAVLVEESAIKTFGRENVNQLRDSNFVFNGEGVNKRTLLGKDGETVSVDKDAVQGMTFTELEETFEDPIVVLAEQEFKNFTPAFSGKKIIEEQQEFVPEDELQKNLYSLMQQMGIKTTSLEEYKSKYTDRNGVEPSAQALADIANRLIAFVNGEITYDSFTEEMAHFIVETVDQTEVENLLRNIHRTEEWAQFSEQYREIYPTEAQVRREVLGKSLANSLKNRFSTEKSQEGEVSIIERMQDMFTNFIERVQAFFKPKFVKDLQKFNEQIYTNLMARDLYGQLNMEQIEGNKLVMYDASKTVKESIDIIHYNAKSTLDLLDSNSKKLRTSKGEVLESKRLLELEDNNSRLRALSQMARVATNHVKYLESAIKNNTNKKYPFSQEEQAVYVTTKGTVLGHISQISSILDVKKPKEAAIKKEIEKLMISIQDLGGKLENSQGQAWEMHVDALVKKHNLTEAQRQQLLKYNITARKDTNWFFAHISSLVHAQDPALNMASSIISKMVTTSNIESNRVIKTMLNKLEKFGFDPRNLKTFKRGNYILGPIDNQQIEAMETEYKTKMYNAIKGTALTEAEFLKKEYDGELDLEGSAKDGYYTEYYKWRKDTFRVDRLKPEARLKKEDQLKGLSKETVQVDQNFSNERGAVNREAQEDGEYTQDQVYRLQEINRARQSAKSPFDSTTSDGFKKGLGLDEEGQVIKTRDVLEGESLVAYELNVLDARRLEEFKDKLKKEGTKDKNIPQKFLDRLQSKDGHKAQWDFVMLNANISFSNEFWDNLSSGESITERLNQVENPDAAVLSGRIKKLQAMRSLLLRKNRVHNQPAETSEEISGTDMDSIKDIEEQLQALYSSAKEHLPKTEFVENETYDSQVNEAYLKEARDRDGDDEIEFVRKHVTSGDRNKIDSARVIVNEVLSGKRQKLTGQWANVFTEGGTRDQLNTELLEYARTKLLPYYKRLEPQGYSSIMEDVYNGNLSATEFISKVQDKSIPFINFTPNFIFNTETDNSDLNPEYMENEKYGREQIKKKYHSKEYQDKFGDISYTETRDPKTGEIKYTPQASREQNEFGALQAIMDMHSETLRATNNEGIHNKYLIPQKGQRGLRQWEELSKGFKASTFKEIWKDATSYREDDSEYGQTADGRALGGKQGAMIIPKYGFTKMQNQEDVTDELLSSYTWMANEAQVYKSRVGAFADMETIKQIILQGSYSGKEAEASLVYKMFDNAYKYNIYGQSESFSYETDFFGLIPKKINLAPLAKKFQWWVRLVNLGFSLVVPLTSFTQGNVNLIIERAVGERLDKDASKLSNKILGKYLSGAIGDTLKFNSKSKLNSLSEYFGVFEAQNRYEDSNYGKFVRGMLKTSFISHSIGDAPIKAKAILTILNDYRVADGELINYNQYKRQQKVLDSSIKEEEIRKAWRDFEGDVLINYMDTVDGITTINSEKLAEDLGMILESSEYEAYEDTKEHAIRDTISALVSDLDNMIPMEQKAIAQRHAIFSFFFLHRGWMSNVYNRKFKGRHISTYTGLTEEGNYMGTATFIRDMIKEARNPKNTKAFLAHAKDMWQNADDTTRRSLHRTLTELAIVNTLTFATLILIGMADDDKDKNGEDATFALQFAAYIALRADNEVVTSATAYPRQISEFLSNPIVGLDKMQNLADVWDLTSSEEVSAGKYRGSSKRQRFLFKNTPLIREYNAINNVDETRKTYRYFNQTNLESPWVWSTFLLSQEDE